MRLSLLTRYLHEAECVEICIRLLVVIVDVDLGVRILAYIFLRTDHHGALHARIRDVWLGGEDDERLLKFNDLLISRLSQLILLRDDCGRLDPSLVKRATNSRMCQVFINFLEGRRFKYLSSFIENGRSTIRTLFLLNHRRFSYCLCYQDLSLLCIVVFRGYGHCLRRLDVLWRGDLLR